MVVDTMSLHSFVSLSFDIDQTQFDMKFQFQIILVWPFAKDVQWSWRLYENVDFIIIMKFKVSRCNTRRRFVSLLYIYICKWMRKIKCLCKWPRHYWQKMISFKCFHLFTTKSGQPKHFKVFPMPQFLH